MGAFIAAYKITHRSLAPLWSPVWWGDGSHEWAWSSALRLHAMLHIPGNERGGGRRAEERQVPVECQCVQSQLISLGSIFEVSSTWPAILPCDWPLGAMYPRVRENHQRRSSLSRPGHPCRTCQNTNGLVDRSALVDRDPSQRPR